MRTERSIVLDVDDKTYYADPMVIKSTHLGTEDHAIGTFFLHCEGDGTGVGVGGCSLNAYDEDLGRRVGTAFGLDFIFEVLRVVGVESWEKLPGNAIWVLRTTPSPWGSTPVGIAHPIENRHVIFADFAAWWKEREA